MNKHLTPQKKQLRHIIRSRISKDFRSSLFTLLIAVFAATLLSSCVKQGAGTDESRKMAKKSGRMDKSSMAGTDGKAMDSMQKMEKDEIPGAETPAGDSAKDIALQAALDHDALFAESRYPSAATCGTCHPKHYKEWAVSSHSYAQLSPVYMSLNSEINELTSGTDGDFCLRCHSPIGANLGESPFISNLERHPTSREGITCVVCHRMNKDYNKRSGRLALVEGDLLQPIYGPARQRNARLFFDSLWVFHPPEPRALRGNLTALPLPCPYDNPGRSRHFWRRGTSGIH